MAGAGSGCSAGVKSLVERLKNFKLKPITTENVLYYYTPLQGAFAYTFLSVNVMNPSLVTRLFPKYDVANILLCSSLVGSGMYIFNRSHLRRAPTELRVSFSIFGAVIFSLGSVLLWAIMRGFVPKNVALCSTIGISSGVGLMYVGTSYLNYVDSALAINGPKK